jgi:signal transduction histidine kinase
VAGDLGGRVGPFWIGSGTGHNRFDPEALPDQAGMGLANIRERALKMGGTAIIHSTPGSGTKIKVTANLGQKSGRSGQGERDG